MMSPWFAAIRILPVILVGRILVDASTGSSTSPTTPTGRNDVSTNTPPATNDDDFVIMLDRIKNKDGFLAALDQSGGSTPKALNLYGCPPDSYIEGEESMFEAMHTMRCRIMTSPSFHGERGILGAIIFEDTMDRTVSLRTNSNKEKTEKDMEEEQPTESLFTAQYLWRLKRIVPFLKIDKGLLPETNGVQLLKPIPKLEELLQRGKQEGIFGTKMRSVIHSANEKGIKELVEQQFDIGQQVLQAGLVPILEPEVDINSPEKKECEEFLRTYMLQKLDELALQEKNDEDNDNNQNLNSHNHKVMLKVTLPSIDHFYQACVDHPNCLRVVALSGGYSREEAIARLAQQAQMIASFSRALTEGLAYSMTDEEFDAVLQDSIHVILKASKA